MATFVNFDKAVIDFANKVASNNDQKNVAEFVLAQYKDVRKSVDTSRTERSKQIAEQKNNPAAAAGGMSSKRKAALDKLKSHLN